MRPVFQPFSDDIKLINPIELVDWDDERTQFLVCEACGMPGCESGCWVSVRRSDSLVLFLPSSEHIWREKKDYMEYCPPELFVGSSEGNHAEHVKILEDFVQRQYQSNAPAVLRSRSDNERVISFYLDAAAFSAWQAMVFDGSEYRLMVGSKYVVA